MKYSTHKILLTSYILQSNPLSQPHFVKNEFFFWGGGAHHLHLFLYLGFFLPHTFIQKIFKQIKIIFLSRGVCHWNTFTINYLYLFRIWDLMFRDGQDFIFKAALGILYTFQVYVVRINGWPPSRPWRICDKDLQLHHSYMCP